MKVTTKSILIARKKDIRNPELPYVVEIKLFDINNPHLTSEVPTKVLEFKGVECVEIKGLSVSYFVRGNDVVLNDANTVRLEQRKNVVVIEKG